MLSESPSMDVDPYKNGQDSLSLLSAMKKRIFQNQEPPIKRDNSDFGIFLIFTLKKAIIRIVNLLLQKNKLADHMGRN